MFRNSKRKADTVPCQGHIKTTKGKFMMEGVVWSACRTEHAQPSGMQGDVWDGLEKRG